MGNRSRKMSRAQKARAAARRRTAAASNDQTTKRVGAQDMRAGTLQASSGPGALAPSVPVELIDAFWVANDHQLPAICGRCGTWFRSSVRFGLGSNITFAGATAGPCPVCGGIGRIPDGTYDFSEAVHHAVQESTEDQIRAVEAVLAEVSEQTDPAAVADEVERAGGSAWQRVVQYFKPSNGTQLVGYVSAILLIIKTARGL